MTLLSLMESSSDIWPPLQPHAGSGATVEEEDAFLGFVTYARSMLFPDECAEDFHGPSWSWLVSRIFKTCIAYPSGVTSGILLSDLFQAWCEQRRFLTSKKNMEWMIPLKRRRRRRRLPNTVTIDSIFEKNFLSPTSCLEAVVLRSFLLPEEVMVACSFQVIIGGGYDDVGCVEGDMLEVDTTEGKLLQLRDA
ncbi:hypothetical protein KFK09_011417 [Dendrobium nobile]|uniref:Cell division control protein 24 OB domain-containing protein n=1 Tax=Dendrobium nobile TaxID=94219 RepID=A0A8T3BI70_DENNO|nr:hypothetical protein KFK09_011417 [Dendrobium nobile]